MTHEISPEVREAWKELYQAKYDLYDTPVDITPSPHTARGKALVRLGAAEAALIAAVEAPLRVEVETLKGDVQHWKTMVDSYDINYRQRLATAERGRDEARKAACYYSGILYNISNDPDTTTEREYSAPKLARQTLETGRTLWPESPLWHTI